MDAVVVGAKRGELGERPLTDERAGAGGNSVWKVFVEFNTVPVAVHAVEA